MSTVTIKLIYPACSANCKRSLTSSIVHSQLMTWRLSAQMDLTDAADGSNSMCLLLQFASACLTRSSTLNHLLSLASIETLRFGKEGLVPPPGSMCSGHVLANRMDEEIIATSPLHLCMSGQRGPVTMLTQAYKGMCFHEIAVW